MRDSLLADLKEACVGTDPSAILRALEALLSWLELPEHNNDQNCRAVDLFVCLQVWPLQDPALPEALRLILFDVGSQLHDTHSATGVARDFESTPAQLLKRTRELSLSLT
jgi:hypothetical protein